MLRTLVVDDEAHARNRIRAMLLDRDDVQLVGECRDGCEAISAIRDLTPDLVFLDIQMPEMNGFDVTQSFDSPTKNVAFVVVSAFSEHAVRAFEVNVVDYLLKPFNTNRLDKAIRRVQQLTDQGNGNFERVGSENGYRNRIALRYGGSLHLVETSKIFFIEAARNYVHVNTANHDYLLRESLKNLEQYLDPQKFIRIHRSYIVNVNCVESFEPTFNGDYRVLLTNGSSIPLSRSYRAAMRSRFGSQI